MARWLSYPIFVIAAILYTPMALYGRTIDVRCNGNAAADTNRLKNSIASSNDGDLIRIHNACEVNQTIVLLGNRTYEGNSRTGSIIRQADDTNLPAVVASDSIYGVRQHAVYANRCYGTTVADNYIEDFGRDGGADSTWYGIGCTVQGDVGSVIRDNKVFNGGSQPSTGAFRFIGIPQVNYGPGVINITGNVMRGSNAAANSTALYYSGGSHPLRVMSKGNQVFSAGTPITIGPNAVLVEGF